MTDLDRDDVVRAYYRIRKMLGWLVFSGLSPLPVISAVFLPFARLQRLRIRLWICLSRGNA